MKSELIVIDPSEYGLEDNTAQKVQAVFSPMLEKMVQLEQDFNDIKAREITKELCKEAKALRLQYVKVRTGTEKIHKELKANILAEGRFYDGWKNAQKLAGAEKEEKLKEIETHFERIEEAKKAELQNNRANELTQYDPGYIPADLGTMPADIWVNYLNGVKLSFEQKKEAERKSEADRIEAERKAELQKSRSQKLRPYYGFYDENVILSDLSETQWIDFGTKAKQAKEAHETEEEKIRLENEKLRKEAEERERLHKIEQEKRRKEAETERLEKERLEKEIQAKKEEEQREIERQKKEEQERLSMGDKEKYNEFLKVLAGLENSYKFESEQYKKRFSQAINTIKTIK